ncbi:MAG TPA: hypothetical protein VHN15_14005 [Thermoanaerobaculia bacterium]|nr:hypothetical protein [Thermoanaerobaculia bacterium]
MRRLAVRLLLVLGLLAAGGHRAADAAQAPAFRFDRAGLLVVADLPQILPRPEVKPHLSTGLTTSFVLRVTAVDGNGRKLTGAGQVDIRYEPWDEVYLTRRVGADRLVRKETVASYEGLLTWWRSLEVPVLASGATGVVGGPSLAAWNVRVEVEVIPFSRSEQREAQRWISDSLEGGGRPPAGERPGRDETAGAAGEEGLDGVLDLLLATSIKRRSLVSYSWKAAYRPGPERRP